MSILCFVTTLIKQFDKPKFRPIRALMFVLAGLSIIVTFIVIRVWPNENKVETDLYFYALGGAIYIIGAGIYTARVPERCKPGTFDLCCASH
jgi:adiponectin receptor